MGRLAPRRSRGRVARSPVVGRRRRLNRINDSQDKPNVALRPDPPTKAAERR
ncbi:hypothetical protein [Mycobacterium sp. PSTR-4-N]|uniref:hypothetical protein n=1 Tax=Mycobacterium sp. PSTR-4-N TaxID=2917745 RepID=UPI001F1512D2|nr:hypothetical protein [Mycobacterium sp. PSTR-4-N]MCG7597512.1 hypothetical protein [Mycobacterium sp. PSTR-4-N]MDW5610457.1 hypothetical protein [Mycolicibacterium sp. D5.8-2]